MLKRAIFRVSPSGKQIKNPEKQSKVQKPEIKAYTEQ